MRLTNKGVMFEQLKSVSPSAKSGYLSLVDIDDTELLISETEIMRMCDVVNHKRLEWSISCYISHISKKEKLHTLNAYCAEVYHNNTMVEWFREKNDDE